MAMQVQPPGSGLFSQPPFRAPSPYQRFVSPYQLQNAPSTPRIGPGHPPNAQNPFANPNAALPPASINAQSSLDFTGKQLRRSIYRKTIDYNSSVVRYLENRIWQRPFVDRHAVQPDELYDALLTPPLDWVDNPVNCVTTKFMRQSTNKNRCPIFCVCWTPDGRRLITGASSGEFTLWNGLTFNFETILQAHEGSVRAMVWSHNDQWMITGDSNGFIKYWQSNMNNVKMFQAHKDPVRALSFSPLDTKFASCSDDGTVRVFDFRTSTEELTLRGHGADVKCVDWHPQKSLIISGSKDSQQPIILWDPKSGKKLNVLHAHKNTCMDLRWNPHNGLWLATASRDHLCKVFDLRNLKEEMQTFRAHKKEASALAWHPVHETLFASAGSDGSIYFWLVGADKELGGMDDAHEGMIWSLSWHPLGHLLVSGSNDHSTKFWTRNRPGDQMTDKYNLNMQSKEDESMLHDDGVGFSFVSSNSDVVMPGLGLEGDMLQQLRMRHDDDGIPGYGSEDADRRKNQSRPVNRQFERSWTTGKTSGIALLPVPPKHSDDVEVERAPVKRGLLGDAPPMPTMSMMDADYRMRPSHDVDERMHYASAADEDWRVPPQQAFMPYMNQSLDESYEQERHNRRGGRKRDGKNDNYGPSRKEKRAGKNRGKNRGFRGRMQ